MFFSKIWFVTVGFIFVIKGSEFLFAVTHISGCFFYCNAHAARVCFGWCSRYSFNSHIILRCIMMGLCNLIFESINFFLGTPFFNVMLVRLWSCIVVICFIRFLWNLIVFLCWMSFSFYDECFSIIYLCFVCAILLYSDFYFGLGSWVEYDVVVVESSKGFSSLVGITNIVCRSMF